MNPMTRPATAFAALVLLLAAASSAPAADNDATARLIAELGLEESAIALADRPGWQKPRKIVVIGADAERIAWMQPAAPGVKLVGAADRTGAVREVADADAVIGPCTAEVVQAGPRLRWIQHLYAGVEGCIGIPGFADRGIVLSNMQKIAGPVMSEHVLAFMFALARGFATYVPAQTRGEWADEAVPENRMWSLEGKTLLVAGLGGIGSEVARRAHALGMIVIATRNTPREKPPYVSEQGLSADLPGFVSRADVIVNALPLTPETKGVFDRRIFDAAKRGALFINVGRGGTVVTADLVAALQDGRIGGAGLDVTDPEPLPADHPLWRAPNVLITPHVAAATDLGEEPRWLIARENLRRYVAGGKLLSEVDVKRGY
ncbi:MAG TPA: D-2-hydroxyacid dehydrogenase [Steroidobacteraceae bacterium]